MLLNPKLVRASKVFIDAPEIQYFDNVIIITSLPFSEIEFNKENFYLAVKVTAVKTLSGFNEESNVKIFLNNKIIYKKNLMFWDNEDNF